MRDDVETRCEMMMVWIRCDDENMLKLRKRDGKLNWDINVNDDDGMINLYMFYVNLMCAIWYALCKLDLDLIIMLLIF